MLKSVIDEKIFPKQIHVQPAALRFPNGSESGNWETMPQSDSETYFRLSSSQHEVAKAIWPVIGTDFTFEEAQKGADNGEQHHKSCLKYAYDLATAAISAMSKQDDT